MSARPPVPARCAHRPQVGGLVVPAITLHHPHAGFLLGRTRADLVAACIRDRLCQVCGAPLTDRVVVICRARDIVEGYSAEPGLHPECAAYSTQACPMLDGRMTHYRAHPVALADKECDAPACTCHLWRSDPGQAARAGELAEDYLAVWLRLEHYRPDHDDRGKVRGVALRGVPRLRVRQIPAPHRQRPVGGLTRTVLAMSDLQRLLTP